MGMPNIPPTIDSNINIDSEDILNIFYENIKKNKKNINNFFQNEKEFLQYIRRIKKGISEEEINKIMSSFAEIKTIILEKDKIDQEQMKSIKKTLIPINSTNTFYTTLVIFILLSYIYYKNYLY